MKVYMYGNYVSDDIEVLEERISEDIAKYVKSIASVETLTASACEDIEEFDCSCKGIFDMMRQGYIFLDICGKES